MYRIFESKAFKRSYRRLLRSGKIGAKARAEFIRILHTLRSGNPLPSHNRDHALVGEQKGYRECHIKGDLLLVYEVRDDVLILVLVDIGSHSELFG